jgi:hypothetical protein
VIRVTAAIVPDDRANIFRRRFQITDQVLDGLLFEISFAFERIVQVVDVSLVMLGVMDLHCLRIDVRFQSIVRIR